MPNDAIEKVARNPDFLTDLQCDGCERDTRACRIAEYRRELERVRVEAGHFRQYVGAEPSEMARKLHALLQSSNIPNMLTGYQERAILVPVDVVGIERYLHNVDPRRRLPARQPYYPLGRPNVDVKPFAVS